MQPVPATPEREDEVIRIVCGTIKAVYPAYYPRGAVEFFLEYHSDEAIRSAIGRGEVLLFEEDGTPVATGSIEGNYLTRVFVSPEYQGRGIGSRVMDCLEAIAFRSFPEARLDASLPAAGLYLKRGYEIIGYHRKAALRGHYLCYLDMKKARPPV